MPPFRLPLAAGETPHIAGEHAEALAGLLAPVNDPTIQARLGQEREVARRVDGQGTWLQTTGERFTHAQGWVQGHRYLLLVEDQPVAVLNLTARRTGRAQEMRVSNVFVAPAYRRRGLASALLGWAQAEHPRLVADSSFSAAGAALVGADRPAPTRRPRRP